MQLAELFRDIAYTGTLPEGEAELVVRDSRKIAPGAVFVCTRGARFDSHQFAPKALKQGASLVVTERPLGLEREVTVENGAAAYALLCHNFFGRPAEKLKLAAVTGTNGKTTVSFVLKQILEKAGLRCGLIGTIRSEVAGMEIPAKFTTPEPWDLDALFARMVNAGCQVAVLEASSQALAQLRLYGLTFEVAAFTNLTQDHLDYHKTMENYYQAKRSLFFQSRAAVINLDDGFGRRLLGEISPQRVIGYSEKECQGIWAENLSLQAGGVQFTLQSEEGGRPVQFCMPGDYSAHNALCAAGMAMALGLSLQQAAEGLCACLGVRGRCEVLYSGRFTIICDFAHTADGIEKVLSGLAPFVEGRLYVLFGCAGERDATKRHDMARAALGYADEIILTSDNPRSENPYKILEDAESVLRTGAKPYLVEVERRRAIVKALELLQDGDMLVLCGKGHEDYQAIDGVTIYLDEHRIVADWLHKQKLL